MARCTTQARRMNHRGGSRGLDTALPCDRSTLRSAMPFPSFASVDRREPIALTLPHPHALHQTLHTTSSFVIRHSYFVLTRHSALRTPHSALHHSYRSASAGSTLPACRDGTIVISSAATSATPAKSAIW